MRTSSLTLKFLLRCAITATWMSTGLCLAEGPNAASVSGSVVLLENGSVTTPAMGVRISFQGKNGRIVEGTTDEKGKYRVILPVEAVAGDLYEVSVARTGLCTVHRPGFEAKPGMVFGFDFVVAFCGSSDHVQLDIYGERNQYREERVPYGKSFSRELILSFGLRQEGNGSVRYEPFNVSANTRLPVTASFGTYTVRADEAVLDQRTKTLKVEGNVSVADGGTSPPVSGRCIVVELDDTDPRVRPCPVRD